MFLSYHKTLKLSMLFLEEGKYHMIKSIVGVFLLSILTTVPGTLYLVEPFYIQSPCQRRIHVTRHYEIPVQKGKHSVAAVPALMSFWGATNWQVIKSSKFTYSEEPNSVAVISDNLGMPRRYYKLTWTSPKADKIVIEQKMDVQLAYFNNLYTNAKLPYSNEIKECFAESLKSDEKEGINPNNQELWPICDAIVKNSRDAESVVEGVCTWINENIDFEMKTSTTSDDALSKRKGSCTPMAKLACAMLRRIGIPAEEISAKFIDSTNGHTFIEVYFPDAGWVFYDVSNWNRGFKSLDCLVTVGWAYRSGSGGHMEWTNGYFCREKDAASFEDRSVSASQFRTRTAPDKKPRLRVAFAHHINTTPPPAVKPRHQSIRELTMDLKVSPGVRDYSDAIPE